MLRLFTLSCLLLNAVIIMGVTASLEELDREFPRSCTTTFTLNVEKSPAAREEIQTTLDSWVADTQHTSLFLIHAPSDGETARRDLIEFGPPSPEGPRPADWFTRDLTGTITPSDARSTASLTAPYCVDGTSGQAFSKFACWVSMSTISVISRWGHWPPPLCLSRGSSCRQRSARCWPSPSQSRIFHDGATPAGSPTWRVCHSTR